MSNRRRRRLQEIVRGLDVLWACQCEGSNISTARCRFCGTRPPRHLRSEVAARPAPDLDALLNY